MFMSTIQSYENMDKVEALHTEMEVAEEKSTNSFTEQDPDTGLSIEERKERVCHKPCLLRQNQYLMWDKERKFLRKLDLALIPWLCLLYFMSFLDRTNIGNAKIAGLQRDLRMSNSQWNASLAIFFVSYSIFEPVSNVLLKRLRPKIYIPSMWVEHFSARFMANISKYVLVGDRNHLSRSRHEFLRSCCNSLVPWIVRSRSLPWLQFLSFLLV